MHDQRTFANSIPHFSSEDAFELILNNIEDVYVLVGKDFTILALNKAARQGIRLHYKREVSPGFYLLDLVTPERQEFLLTLFAEVLKGTPRKTETDFILEDGDKVYYANTFAPAYNSNGSIIGIVARATNVTGARKIETIIQESEQRLRFALEATNQGAWDWDMITDEVIYSSSYKKMYGFTDDLKNHISEWESRVHPEDMQRLKNAISEHVQSEDVYYESTYRLQMKNGDYKWIMARGKLISKDNEGKPLRMIGTHTDISERVEIQEKLKTVVERFTYAAKATGQALWEWNPLTGEAYISASFTELFGWATDDDHYFEQWHNYIHPDDQMQTVTGYYENIANPAAATWQEEYRFKKADGTYAIVCDKAYILRDETGKALKVIGATQDITAKKVIEEELYKSNERYNNMVKATNELLWEWDIESNTIYRAKEGLKKIYGFSEDRTIRTMDQWMQRIHADDQKKLNTILSNLLKANHEQTFEVEYRFKKDDDTYAFIYDRGILLRNESGQPTRVIGAAQDVSERKRLENELLKNELEYKKAINQATVDSQEQERGEIGKELHDNVNQVLTTTKLYLELALANEDLVKELVKKSSKNIGTVINEIRQLSRSLMDPTLGDLGIVDSINDLIENINLTRKVHIDVTIAEGVERLLNKAQKLTIFRIIQESLNNIIKHANAQLVSISLRYENEMAELIVADDGIGFSHELTRKGAGLKNITNRVYLINGLFSIDSKANKGCRIKISFPLK